MLLNEITVCDEAYESIIDDEEPLLLKKEFQKEKINKKSEIDITR